MKNNQRMAILVADLGYGDAGKGSIVDYLTREHQAHTVVRYNGGAQAAHNVLTADGRHHTFAQFGSGSLVPGTRTHLSRFMIIHPLAMLAEERHLQSLGVHDAFERMSIDREALITSSFQQSANRIKEIARGSARHGSCGMGVGETMSDWLSHGSQALVAGDLENRQTVVKKLGFLKEAKLAGLKALRGSMPDSDAARQEWQTFDDPNLIEVIADFYERFAQLVRIVDAQSFGKSLEKPGAVIFEGAQGVLLDEWYGFAPYNSWSTLTFKNADNLLAEQGYDGQVLKLGLTRGYATRHGAGPFVTEDEVLTQRIQDAHNANNPWQRKFRVGYLDFVATRYAMAVTGKLDGLVVTNLDRMQALDEWKTCAAYQATDEDLQNGEFFEMEQGRVSDIKVPADPTDLEKQAQLTDRLFRMQPIYTPCETDPQAYVDFISRTLDVPALITSNGPLAEDKINNQHAEFADQSLFSWNPRKSAA